jgi:hypothetical protein
MSTGNQVYSDKIRKKETKIDNDLRKIAYKQLPYMLTQGTQKPNSKNSDIIAMNHCMKQRGSMHLRERERER